MKHNKHTLLVFIISIIYGVLLSGCGQKFQDYVSTNGKFSIQMPDRPLEVSNKFDNFELLATVAYDKKNNEYGVYRLEYHAPTDFNNALPSSLVLMTSTMSKLYGNSLFSHSYNEPTELTVNCAIGPCARLDTMKYDGGYSGFQFVFEELIYSTVEHVNKGRIFSIDENTFYVIYARYEPDNLSSGNVDIYLNSFVYNP